MKLKSLLHKIVAHSYFSLLIYSILFTGISYISLNTASQIYDYPFHLARIVGLAQSLQNQDWLPNLNYVFLNGSGYGVPMFYGNWMFYIPALIFLVTKLGTMAFASFVWLLVFATSCTSYYTVFKITGNKKRAFLLSIAAPASITYFGLGMTAVVPLIPLLIYALYKVLYLNKLNPILLAILIALLVQTHIISTLVLAIASAIFVLFNVTRLSLKKLGSFISSVLIAICLSLGFILQYLEQNQSQIFFLNWPLRDYPFPAYVIMRSKSFLDIIQHYYFPIALIFLLLALIYLRKLNTLSRQLLGLSLLLLIASTEALPWDSLLRYSFLAIFQYVERLIYFLPLFILMAICISAPKKVVTTVVLAQLLAYLFSNPLAFLPHASNYATEYGLLDSNITVMRNQNSKATNAFENPLTTTYDTSGDEYLNLVASHDNVRNGTITQFEYDPNTLQISNIEQGYNKLEFDVELLSAGEQTLVLPRIWYKGYVSIYSNGANGSQPSIAYASLSSWEKQEYMESKKPATAQKALYDGRAVIKVSDSGHVKITYQKTAIQLTGFILEFISFMIVIAYLIVNFFKHKEMRRC